MSVVTLTAEQTEALRPLLDAADAPRFVLIGAAALSVYVPLERPTYDVDLVLVASPKDYEPWFERHGWRQLPKRPHRWVRGDVQADVLPATNDVIRAGEVTFEDGAVMSTVGFDLVLAHAQWMPVTHTELRIEVASLATLVVLKMAAWLDRPHEREKDLDDLMHTFRRALPEDADCRWDLEHPVGACGFDFEFQSAFHVGLEVGRATTAEHEPLLSRFLTKAQDEESACFGRLALAYRAYEDATINTRYAMRAFKQGWTQSRPDRRLAGRVSEEDAARAVSAASGMDALAMAPLEPEPADPAVVAAYARGRAAREELIDAEGGVASADEIGKLLGGISRPAVDKARKAGRLLALRERGDWLYPRWQVHGGAILEGLPSVLAELEAGEHDTWAKMIFFLETDTERDGESPLEALRAGRQEVALRAARAYGEHGAR
jgi:predicted nucleotidyltransferase